MLSLLTLILMIIRFTCVIHCQTNIDGIILNQHNEWRALIANGYVNNHPKGANMERLLWEYTIQQMAQNYTNKCETDIPPSFNINTIKNTNFSFEADFTKYSFGHNSAYIQYQKNFDFASDTQQLINMTKYLINEWFGEHKNYIFGDTVSSNTTNYFNAAGAVTRYIGCSIKPCTIFLCKDCDCIPKVNGICIRHIYLNCFYFPSIEYSLAINKNKLYENGNECTQCTIDRNNKCENGLCSDCPSNNYYKCQNANSCHQTPNNPCDNYEFAKNCPKFCDNKCQNLTSSNDSICYNQPQLPINPTISPTFEPTEAPTNSPTIIPIITTIPTIINIPSGSNIPTINPTNFRTNTPTINPSDSSSIEITDLPTINPSILPTETPSELPSEYPTTFPTDIPTDSPVTHAPTTIDETINPSSSPTIFPTRNPSISPTKIPSESPLQIRSISPTFEPSKHPTETNSSSEEFICGINFLPFSEYSECTRKCNGGRMKRTRLVYYYGCDSDSITYLGKQIVSKKCNTHKCIVK